MNAGDLKPDILLDPLVILTDILDGLLGRTTTVPVLLPSAVPVLSRLSMFLISVEVSLLGTVLTALLIAVIVPLFLFLRLILVSFLLRGSLSVSLLGTVTSSVTVISAGLSSPIAVVVSRCLISVGRGIGRSMIDLIRILFAHLLPPYRNLELNIFIISVFLILSTVKFGEKTVVADFFLPFIRDFPVSLKVHQRHLNKSSFLHPGMGDRKN